jgi:hypothetical protein
MKEEIKDQEVQEAQVPEGTPAPDSEAQQEVAIEKAEAATGIRESAQNKEAIESVSDEDVETDSVALPSFFVEEEDRVEVDVDILFDKKNGRMQGVSRKGAMGEEDDFELFGFCTEKFEFSPIGYEQMANYRQRCGVFRRDANRLLTDPISLRNYVIVWHLKDWSLRDRNGEKIELSFAESGALDDESIAKVYSLQTTLLDVVLTLFESDMMM